MCGLLAYFSTDADRVDDGTVTAVRSAQHCLRHRGPDETQVWSDDRVVYGFNRLSFIDIEHSHQPMPYADGRSRIVFNGEIYNYVELREELKALGATFATEGDTEAIVAGYHLWGEDVVHRLRGMFAFLIWDSQEQKVFGARDPFGIKPLFVTRLADGGIAFSSEKKALLDLLGGSKAAGGVDAASLPPSSSSSAFFSEEKATAPSASRVTNSGLMPKGSRAPKTVFSWVSQMRKANMPRSRWTTSWPHWW